MSYLLIWLIRTTGAVEPEPSAWHRYENAVCRAAGDHRHPGQAGGRGTGADPVRDPAASRSVAAASAPATGSVRSDTTKKPSMVGDGANDPKTTWPFRPGSASDTLAAARPTRWAGVTRMPTRTHAFVPPPEGSW